MAELKIELETEKLKELLDNKIIELKKLSGAVNEILRNKEIQMEGSNVLRGLREDNCCYYLPPGEFIKKYNLSKPGLICNLLESYHQYRLKENQE